MQPYQIIYDNQKWYRLAISMAFVISLVVCSSDEPRAMLSATANTNITETLSETLLLGAKTIQKSTVTNTVRCKLDLVQAKDNAEEALWCLRRAHAQVLRDIYGRFRKTQNYPESQYLWEAAIQPYFRLRDIADREEAYAKIAPALEQPFLAKQKLLRTNQLIEVFKRALTALELPTNEYDFYSAPADRELILTCHPVAKEWLCVAADKQETIAAHINSLDQVLAPFAKMIMRAIRLRVLAYGGLAEVDFDKLPWNGGFLGDHLSVVYSLDLPPESNLHDANSVRNQSLVMLDPQGNAPTIREAELTVQQGLMHNGWHVRALQGPRWLGSWPGRTEINSPLTRERLLKEISISDLFFTAGHAEFFPNQGWLNALAIPDSLGLTVSDILAIGSVPRQVALIGCNTGSLSEETGGQERLGLAQAFLLRGSEQVLAAVRPLSVKEGAALARLLAGRILPLRRNTGSDSLSRTLAELRRTSPEADLGALRIFVP